MACWYERNVRKDCAAGKYLGRRKHDLKAILVVAVGAGNGTPGRSWARVRLWEGDGEQEKTGLERR